MKFFGQPSERIFFSVLHHMINGRPLGVLNSYGSPCVFSLLDYHR